MAKEATLPKAYAYGRKIYTPEDTEIPDELFDVLVEAGVLNPDGTARPQDGGTEADALREKLNKQLADLLIAAGYDSVSAVSEASDEELLAIDGIGDTKLQQIRDAL